MLDSAAVTLTQRSGLVAEDISALRVAETVGVGVADSLVAAEVVGVGEALVVGVLLGVDVLPVPDEAGCVGVDEGDAVLVVGVGVGVGVPGLLLAGAEGDELGLDEDVPPPPVLGMLTSSQP
jgi:hypothetical protein